MFDSDAPCRKGFSRSCRFFAALFSHHCEQSSDLMRDPEMLFEVAENDRRDRTAAVLHRNDYVGVEQQGRYRNESGDLICLPQRAIWKRTQNSAASFGSKGAPTPG
jgi:hypothetical protein